MPLIDQRGCDKTHRSGIEAVGRDHQKTQDKDDPLKRRESLRIDKVLHIDRGCLRCHGRPPG
jgi:hypothetical protein